MAKLRVGIVGCGAIGSSLAKAIAKDFKAQAVLAALYDIDASKARKLSSKKASAVGSLQQLIRRSDLVIEAASAKASWDIAKRVLGSGKDIMLMSVGGIVGHRHELSALARKRGARVYIPSGAICGIDALKAAKIAKIKKVTLTTRKNPAAFGGVKYIEQKGIRLEGIKKDKVLFSGPAEEAVQYFPQNINVAAVLSLAGIGARNTLVKIIASPWLNWNIHEVQIESSAGKIFTRTENLLHPDNPKTSYLAVLSAIATLKQILEPVRIGA